MALKLVNEKTRAQHRNARVKKIDRDAWRRERKVRFNRAVNYAAAAKATRTALEVTQAEIARFLDCSLTAVVQRENGFHAWSGGALQLAEYQRACMKIAGVR